MLEKGQISNRQLVFLLCLTILATAILFLPSVTTAEAKQDAWISTIISIINAVIYSTIAVKLSQRFPGESFIQYTQKIVGKHIGKIIGLGFIFYTVHTNAIIVREFGEFMKTVFMTETPLIVFLISIVVLSSFAVKSGLEVIARMSEWIFFIVVSSLLFIIILAIPEMDLNFVLPINEEGFGRIVKGSLSPSAWFGEVIIFTMIFPFVRDFSKSLISVIIAQLITGLILLIGIIQIITIFGPELVSIFKFALIYVVRLVSVVDFIERIEPLVMVAWVSGVFIKVSVFYYVSVLSISQLFNLSDYKTVVYPVGIILASLSFLVFDDVIKLSDFLANIWPIYSSITYHFGIPILLYLISLFFKIGGRVNEN